MTELAYDDVTSRLNLCSAQISYYSTCLYTLWYYLTFVFVIPCFNDMFLFTAFYESFNLPDARSRIFYYLFLQNSEPTVLCSFFAGRYFITLFLTGGGRKNFGRHIIFAPSLAPSLDIFIWKSSMPTDIRSVKYLFIVWWTRLFRHWLNEDKYQKYKS